MELILLGSHQPLMSKPPVTNPAVQDTTATAYLPGKLELLLLGLGLLVMYVPTYMFLDRQVWSRVGQGHGPVMLALVIWLLWQRWPRLVGLPFRAAPMAASASLLLGLLMYVVGRSQDLMAFDTASQILVLGALLLYYKGWAGLKLMWFPLFFIIFLIPLPTTFVDAATAPLKLAVSHVSELLLYEAGYPIGRAGVTLTIGNYNLLVADACAGINSIFALEAIGVFYMSVAGHANKLRNMLLALLILPISFVSNVIRVCVLVLVTYYFGDEAGQGFVHDFAGILLFMLATALTIGVDSILGLFLKNKGQAA
jgi:exosortase B